MINYHAVMIGEDGMEFGADVRAKSREEAHEKLREDYPESRVEQLESPADTRKREQDLYDHIAKGGDWDEEGRPIFHFPQEEDDDGECDLCGGPLIDEICPECDEESE